MEKNNFDAIRIVLALIVVFFHISALTQLANLKFFQLIFDANFAVMGFFAISGFLVTKSYLTSKSLFDYFEKRLRRIYPAYLTSIIICLCIASYVSTLNLLDFFSSSYTLKYLFSNISFLNFIQPSIPHVFDNNPIQALNGSLWTIKIEVMLYFCVPIIIFMFNRFGSLSVTSLIALLSMGWVYFFQYKYNGNLGIEISRQFPGQLSYFIIGSLFAVNKEIFSKIKWILLASLIAIIFIKNSQLRLLINPIAYSSIVIFSSTSFVKSLNFGKFGDISYGIYLYHFPIIQLLYFLNIFQTNILLGLGLTFSLTIITSLFSWHVIEKHLLKRSSHYVIANKN